MEHASKLEASCSETDEAEAWRDGGKQSQALSTVSLILSLPRPLFVHFSLSLSFTWRLQNLHSIICIFIYIYISVQLLVLSFSVLSIAVFVSRDRSVRKKSQSVLKS